MPRCGPSCPRTSVPGSALTVVLLAVLLLGACGGDGGGPSGAATSGTAGTPDGDDLRWGDGAYGVVLAHGAAFDAASWSDQATAIADRGATVVAVEDIGVDHLAEVVRGLQDEGVDRVALVGGSAGADSILSLSSEQPDLADQLILLSANSVVEGLGDQPKLFVASEDEPLVEVSRELAESAAGDDNVAMILPGSAHAQNIFDTDQGPGVLDAMLERLARPAG